MNDMYFADFIIASDGEYDEPIANAEQGRATYTQTSLQRQIRSIMAKREEEKS